MKTFSKEVNNVVIEVEPKIQMMNILVALSDERSHDAFKNTFNFHEGNDMYYKEVIDTFSYLKENGFIEKFNKIINDYNLHYQNAFEYALSLDDDFNFKDGTNEFFLKDELRDYSKELKDFYYSKKFLNFYYDHMDEYKSWIEQVKPCFDEYDIVGAIKEYVGDSLVDGKKFYVDFIPCETSGGFSIYNENEIHYCFRTKGHGENNIYFAKGDSKNNVPICTHEFMHGIVNPLTIKHDVFNFKSNYFEGMYPNPGYGNDFCMANEYIVRSITNRLVDLITDLNKSEEDIVICKKNGFPYVEKMVERLKEYENNRDIYPDLDSYMPVLNNYLIELINKDKVKIH